MSQARPRVLGPCFKCAAWGHLAANCPTKDRGVYPFCQPVVSSAELSSDLLSDVIMVDNDQDVQTNTMSLYRPYPQLRHKIKMAQRVWIVCTGILWGE